MLHRVEQQAELLAELPERLEPVVAAVLVAVAHEESVEEGVDVVELGEVFRGGGEERGRGECGRRRGRGEGRGGHGCWGFGGEGGWGSVWCGWKVGLVVRSSG